MFALHYDFDTMDNFLIKRPWYTIFQRDLFSVMEFYNKMGVYNIDIMKEIFTPLFNGKTFPLILH
jgi:hypothetical protein